MRWPTAYGSDRRRPPPTIDTAAGGAQATRFWRWGRQTHHVVGWRRTRATERGRGVKRPHRSPAAPAISMPCVVYRGADWAPSAIPKQRARPATGTPRNCLTRLADSRDYSFMELPPEWLSTPQSPRLIESGGYQGRWRSAPVVEGRTTWAANPCDRGGKQPYGASGHARVHRSCRRPSGSRRTGKHAVYDTLQDTRRAGSVQRRAGKRGK